MALIKNNHIDYYNSIHTQEIQRGDYLKINDNLIQFDFDKTFGISSNSKLKKLTDDEIKSRRQELNRTQVKYLSHAQVKEREDFLNKEKTIFMVKMNKLKNKGDLI